MPHTEHSSSNPDIHLPPSSPDVFLTEYKSARDRLPEGVRVPLDTLREEVMEICKTHGVDHPSKLVLAETHVSTETLERVQELLDQIHYIFEHQKLPEALEQKKEIPLDDREYTLELEPEYNLADLFDVGDHRGGFSCVVYGPSGETEFVMDQNKRLIGDPQGYDDVRFLTDIAGKPAFIAKQGEETFVVWDGKNFGHFEEYEELISLTDVGGKPAFFAKKEDRWFVFWDGKIIGDQEGYKDVGGLIDVGGEPAYTALPDEEGFGFLVMKGDQIVGDPTGYAAIINELVDIGGKVGVSMNRGNSGGYTVLLDGEVVGNEEGYRKVSELVDMDGKIGFVARTKDKQKVLFIMDGQPVSDLTSDVSIFVDEVTNIGGKMACRILGPSFSYHQAFFDKGRLYNDGELINGVQQIVNVAGKPMIVTKGTSDDSHFIEGTRLAFDHIYFLYALDRERFAVVAREGQKIVKRVYPLSVYQNDLIFSLSH